MRSTNVSSPEILFLSAPEKKLLFRACVFLSILIAHLFVRIGQMFYFEMMQPTPNPRRSQKKADLPDIRFHDLRHSAATLLLSLGVHPKVVQELLGHTQISMTMDIYSHVLPSMQQDAVSKLNDLLVRREGGGVVEGVGGEVPRCWRCCTSVYLSENANVPSSF
jgi:integrase